MLIVDEVDDTRTTLEYAVRELQKDVQVAQQQLGREGETTTFSVFVLHVSAFTFLSFVVLYSGGVIYLEYGVEGGAAKKKHPEHVLYLPGRIENIVFPIEKR